MPSSWASSPTTRASMLANRSRDTKPELELRRALHGMGLRYRVCARPLPKLRRTADIVFRPSKVAVEVRGCFWHGCPDHYTRPKANRDFWDDKRRRNIERDSETQSALEQAGWLVIVVWEHDDVETAAAKVAEAVASRRPKPPSGVSHF